MNKAIPWSKVRWLLARLPLPMLALAASYGVFSFSSMFVPLWVAVVQAAAFEITYIGLAAADGLDTSQRNRAAKISIGAVVTSILYNTLAGLFHRNLGWLDALDWRAEWGMAILHGLPLAWVAYLVADLLLHTEAHGQPDLTYALPAQTIYPPPVLVHTEAPLVRSETREAPRYQCPNCGATLSLGKYGAAKRHGHCAACKEH